MKSDRYKLQRIALLPTGELREGLLKLTSAEHAQLLLLIRQQGLQFFWRETLCTLPDLPFVATWSETLKKQCLWDAARYMVQKQTLITLDRLFERECIPYVAFKGAHIREIIYADPAFRPAEDIDLLISPREKGRAVQALCANGYTLVPDPTNISHEVTLTRGNVQLDLHWHIMRPGRTRIDLTDQLLETRQRHKFFWSPDNEMALLVMLVHPVFTKYSTAPQSSIVRLADMRQWLATQTTDWPRLLQLLQETGMKTAAWITATVFADLTGSRLPANLYEAIRPPQPKRFMLEKWLDLNLSSKFGAYPFLPKYVFTLLAHDSLGDKLRFIRVFKAEQNKKDAAMAQLRQAYLAKGV